MQTRRTTYVKISVRCRRHRSARERRNTAAETRPAGVERTLNRTHPLLNRWLRRPPASARTTLAALPLRPHRVGHGESRNGGYRSVTRRRAYAMTRLCQRITPSTNWKSPRGYRPVNKMANHAPITANSAAISRKKSTM
jgi:hypothetical protein